MEESRKSEIKSRRKKAKNEKATIINWNATIDYNQFMAADKTLKNKCIKYFKVFWKPEKVIFEDGTILE